MERPLTDAHGHVTVNERMPTQRFHRFVEEKIKDWLHAHQVDESKAEYEVAFFDEDPLGEISCLVVLHTGDQLWRAWETADNPRVALTRSLDGLKPESSLDETDTETETPIITH